MARDQHAQTGAGETGTSEMPADAVFHMERVTDQAEASLRALIARLPELEQRAMLGEAAALIAHEINNLLTPVVGYCQAALAKPDRPELAQKALQRCLRNAQQAAEVADAILGVSGGDVPRGTCDVREAVRGAIKCTGRDFTKDRIELVVDVPLGIHVAMATPALQQVVMNLVLNARRAIVATGRGGRLEIEVNGGETAKSDNVPRGTQSTTSTQFVNISVRDTGVGMTADEVRNVFGIHRGQYATESVNSKQNPHIVELTPADVAAATALAKKLKRTSLGLEGPAPDPEAVEEWRRGYRSLSPLVAGRVGASAIRVWEEENEATSRSGDQEAGAERHGLPGSDSSKGTGLGIVLCRRLVEAAGGRLWCKSEVGVGTVVGVLVRTHDQIAK